MKLGASAVIGPRGASRRTEAITNRTAAARYARALLDVALKEKADLRAIEAELAGFAGLFANHPTLEKVLLNPAVPVPLKRATMKELIERVKLSPMVAKLLTLLADRDRLVLLPDLLVAYRERLLDHLRIIRAEVTTAVALPADRAKAVERSLAHATGREVVLETHIDPAIIGGIVARVGSTVYDASITRQLAKMRERLVAGS